MKPLLKVLAKQLRVAGNVLDWTVVPGTNLAPGQIAGNLAGGMVLDEVQRHVTGDPTLLPSGEALLEYRKDVGQVPQDARQARALTPTRCIYTRDTTSY
jgi:hypothetical protein